MSTTLIAQPAWNCETPDVMPVHATFAPADLSEAVRSRGLVGSLIRAYWGRVAVTYGLFNLENLLRLALPYVLSLAVADLAASSQVGLWKYVGAYLVHMLIGVSRRVYDTRAYTSIYTDLATWMVVDQRKRKVDVSRVAARSALSRDFVSFFERDMLEVLWALYSVIGALVLLGAQDAMLVALCLLLLVPAAILNTIFGRWTFRLNRLLNDQVEREVAVIASERPCGIRKHYGLLAQLRIRLSNAEAANFGLMEFCVVTLLACSLARCCSVAGGDIARLFGIFPYVVMFAQGLDSVPLVVQQVGRLRDIARRMQDEVRDSSPATF